MKRKLALSIATMVVVPLAVVGLLTVAVIGWSCSPRYWMMQHHCAGWLDDPESGDS